MSASKEGHTEIVKLLLAVPGIDVNVQDKVSKMQPYCTTSLKSLLTIDIIICCVRKVTPPLLVPPIKGALKL